MSDRATPRLVVESFQWPVDVIKGYAIWDTERKMPIARLLIADGEYTVHDDVRGIAQQMADKLNAHDRLTRENDKMREALGAVSFAIRVEQLQQWLGGWRGLLADIEAALAAEGEE